MTPNVAAPGHSFRGAFGYYLHDKGQDAEGRRLATAERVVWSETRNLATDDPHTAKRIMIATASQADALKAAAGIKTTGRKPKNGPVYSYSLSWRQDEAEGITRADMIRAADDTLKLLKADHLQAVIIAHNDTAHPHVHVVINRVDPANGKLHSFTQDWTKLDRWAAAYERERGVIVTPKRQDKDAARAASPDPDKRRAYVQDRLQGQAGRQTPAAALKARGDAQKAAHRGQWVTLAADQKTRHRAILEAAGGRIKERLRLAREEYRPLWAELYGRQKDERRAYEARERHLSGKVRNAIDAVRSRQIRGDGSDRGFLTMAFGYLASREARRAELGARHTGERERLSATTKHQNAAAITAIKDERSKALARERDRATLQADALKASQAVERQEIRAAWKALYQEREQAGRTGERQPRESRARIRQTTKDARRETRAAWLEETTRRTDVARRFEEARRAERPAQQEPDDMKDRFEAATGARRPDARPIPNRTVSVSTPAPVPSPAGDVPPVSRMPAEVPAIDKAKAWGKAQQPSPQQAPPIRRDWAQSAIFAQAPAKPAPAQKPPQQARPAPRTDWDRLARPPTSPSRQAAPDAERSAAPSPGQDRERKAAPVREEAQQSKPRTDWDQLASPTRDRPREIKPLPERSRDLEQDR